jgi:ribosomal protein L40E
MFFAGFAILVAGIGLTTAVAAVRTMTSKTPVESCLQCGARISRRSKFCDKCGTRLPEA